VKRPAPETPKTSLPSTEVIEKALTQMAEELPLLKRLWEAHATQTYMKHCTLRDAGFTDDQAFQLLLKGL